MISLNMRVSSAKKGFFDRDAVVKALDKVTFKALSRFGGNVRLTAQRSIRKESKKHKVSEPGKPPITHPSPGDFLLRKWILYSYDQVRKSVVIGPAVLPGAAGPPALQALEYGGKVRIKGKGRDRVVTIRARPFMNPAFELGKKKLPQFFEEAAAKVAGR